MGSGGRTIAGEPFAPTTDPVTARYIGGISTESMT